MFRLDHLALLKYYEPLSPILFEPIDKYINILKYNVFRLNQLPLLKYYAPLSPILFEPSN